MAPVSAVGRLRTLAMTLFGAFAAAAAGDSAKSNGTALWRADSQGLSWQKTISLVWQDGFPKGGLCLDLAGGVAARGTFLQVWECNGLASQVWIFDSNSYRIYYGAAPNLCLDAGDAKSGTVLQLWECNNQFQQKWVFDGETRAIGLQPAAGITPSVCAFGEPKQGTPVTMAACNKTPQQQWNVWYGTTVRVEQDPRKCLDLPGGKAVPGTLVQVTECSASLSQQWVHALDGGPIVYGGNFADPPLCLDMHDMKSGNHLFVWDCEGFAQQKWSYSEKDKTLYSTTGQGVCLDLEGGKDTDGTGAIVYDCNGCWNQKWIMTHTQNALRQSAEAPLPASDAPLPPATRRSRSCPPTPTGAEESQLTIV